MFAAPQPRLESRGSHAHRTITAAGSARGRARLVAVSSAITYGVPDGNGHPEVGAMLAPQAYSDGTWETCTGTLIAPKVFLTAAHCEGQPRVAVTFDSVYNSATGTTYWGTWVADPSFDQAQSDPHDLAVILLDKAVKGITPARLPPQARSPTSRRPEVHVGRVRRAVGDERPRRQDVPLRRRPLRLVGTLNAITPSWLRISQNPSHRERRHLLRRLRRPELPRRRRDRDEHPRRDDDHRRHALPLDERRLPARHAVGARVPRAVRRAAVDPLQAAARARVAPRRG